MTASATESDIRTYSTAGPIRDGYIEYQASSTAAPQIPNPVAATGFRLGSVQFDSGPFLSRSTGLQVRPWTLGEDWVLDSYSESTGSQFGVDEPGSSQADLTLQFRFLEIDGVTPVAVIPTPEPSTLLTLLFGMALLGCAARRSHA